MVEPIRDLDPARIARNLAAVREKAGEGVEVLVATKYVPLEEMGALAEAGVGLVGENRAQDLAAKRERWGDAFEWDFIGTLQSRKVKQVVPLCRLIHSLASESANRQLERPEAQGARVLVEVNVSGEEGKAGIAPAELGEFIAACPAQVAGPDDDAALHRGPRGIAPALRPPGRAGGRAWFGNPVHGNLSGLGGGGLRRGHDHPPRQYASALKARHNR